MGGGPGRLGRQGAGGENVGRKMNILNLKRKTIFVLD
jgi:hypothetical protein